MGVTHALDTKNGLNFVCQWKSLVKLNRLYESKGGKFSHSQRARFLVFLIGGGVYLLSRPCYMSVARILSDSHFGLSLFHNLVHLRASW